jgi:hypothetical protein
VVRKSPGRSGVLILSAIGVALSERYQQANSFLALGKYEMAREELLDLLEALNHDACWLRYRSSLQDPSAANKLKLKDLRSIECNETRHDRIKVSGVEHVVPLDDSDPYPAKPELQPPGSGWQKPTRQLTSPWVPIEAEAAITPKLEVMWNQEIITEAAKYSTAAAIEIYQWRQCRARLTERRLMYFKYGTGSPLARLNVMDLEEINGLPRTGIVSMDNEAQGTFHPTIPEASMAVALRTGTLVVGSSLTLFMMVLVAYVRAALQCDAIKIPGTIFSALHGSRWFETVGLAVMCIPALSLIHLADSARNSTISPDLAVLAALCCIAALWTAVIALPHTRFARDVERLRGQIRLAFRGSSTDQR